MVCQLCDSPLQARSSCRHSLRSRSHATQQHSIACCHSSSVLLAERVSTLHGYTLKSATCIMGLREQSLAIKQRGLAVPLRQAIVQIKLMPQHSRHRRPERSKFGQHAEQEEPDAT